MAKQSARISVEQEETDRFKSTDPDTRHRVDLEIWDAKQRGTRTDQLDLKFGCAPKRVAEALERLKDLKPGPTAGIGGLEPWQLEPMIELYKNNRQEPPHRQPYEIKHEKQPTAQKPDTIERGEKAQLARGRSEAVQRRATESRENSAQRSDTRQNGALLKAIRDKAAQDKVSEPTAPPVDERPTTPAATNVFESEAAQKAIEAVVRQTKLEFGATDEELHSNERNFRTRGYRLAILLILNHMGVRPEVAGTALNMEALSAQKYFRLAAEEIQDKRSAVYYFTKALCLSMKVSLVDLKGKL